jgi:hypothetical protein
MPEGRERCRTPHLCPFHANCHCRVESKATQSDQVKYWEIIAANLRKAGWSWGCVSPWLPGRNKATNCEEPGITRGLNLARWT